MNEIWIEPKSHYTASGWVDFSGKMTGATITDNNGFTRDYDLEFDSKEAFFAYAKDKAGILW